MSPTPFHRKAPGRKQAVASYLKRSTVMGRLGLNSRKPHLARRISSELFSFLFFFPPFKKKKKVFDTATQEHAAGARGCSLQTELTAVQGHSEPNCVRLLIPTGTFPSQTVHNAKSKSGGSQWPQVGCGGAQARWAPPTLNCAMYW